MQIKPSIGNYTVYASDYCKLDSHVIRGGGTLSLWQTGRMC